MLADSAYGTGALRARLQERNMTAVIKPPPPRAAVLVRAVSEASWEELRERSGVVAVRSADNGAGLVAPAPAVALDLCVSPHPREQRVAGAIIESLP